MPTGMRRGVVTVRGIPTDAFIIEYSRRRTLLMAILCGAFALLGAVLLLIGDGADRFWGAVCLVFFGGGAVALGMQVRRPGRFALTPDGLYSESKLAHAFAPWDAILGVSRAHISRQEMLTVDVTDASLIETSRGIGWLKGLNQSMGMPDLAFPTSLLGERAEVLERAISHYVKHPEQRPRIGTVAELQRLVPLIGAEGHAPESPSRAGNSAVPLPARWILWVGGALGLLASLAAVVGDGDPARQGSRLLGALLFGTTSVAALGSAWLLPRRPRLGRVLGILAAAGGLFLGWVVTQTADEIPRVLVGLAIAGCAAVVAWQLARWTRPTAPTST
ncbi:MAG: STM3941 family protein [Chloroflexota bacterium]